MPIVKPASAKEVSLKAKVDVKRELGASDPFVRRSMLGAIISGICNRVFEFFLSLEDAEQEANPATAVRNLARWANIWSVVRLTGSPAAGALFVNASSGGSGTTIPVNTNFLDSRGFVYTSSIDAVLGSIAIPVTSITRAGSVATVTTTAAHNLASNAIVSISGASQAGYNLSNVVITVLSATTFTYAVDAATVSPATGTISCAATGAVVPINSQEPGETYDLSPNAPLSFENPIGGVEATGNVTFPGVIDGIDVESDDDLRARMLSRIQKPITSFNAFNIDFIAKQEPGVTRVFVQEKTPAIGQVTVYFMRDNDASPIPSAGDVANVKTRLLQYKEAHVADSDVIVAAPTAVSTNFVFSALSPNTASMKSAIEAQLKEFFKKKTSVGVSVVEEAYTAAIYNTIDQTTGAGVASFTLSSPTTDISVAAGQIATLGSVTFP